MDLCQCRLIRADAITVLEEKPYVHLRAANFPAAIPISKWQGVLCIWTGENTLRAKLVNEPNHDNANNSKPSMGTDHEPVLLRAVYICSPFIPHCCNEAGLLE